VNAYSVALASQDDEYAALLRGDGVNLADGKPVAWVLGELSRRAGSGTAPGHVRGPSFFERVLDEGRETGVRHYLLGSTPETLEALQAAIADRFPGARIVGAESPPFRPLTATEQAMQDLRIRAAGADLVWVGLGTPRQDVEAVRLAHSVGRPAIAVGAAFDFLAGTKVEAPRWVQRASLEWLFRFATEPRRLWRRYTIELARFAVLALREVARRPDTVPASVRSLAAYRAGTGRLEWFGPAEQLGA
jgi:N-acetylglucosaminyldiphosphoundecaprenol N-acetyl-beta-D-mannosaminyltransferase